MNARAQPGQLKALQVHTLGPSQVLLAGKNVQWRSDTARQLFLYLLTHPNGQSREHIIESLWYIQADAHANNRFRVTIHRIRLALGWPDAVIEEHGRYRLAEEVLEASDVAAFVGLIGQAPHYSSPQIQLDTYHQALSLYRGEYLQGENGQWVWEVRDQLQTAYVRALLAVARLQCALGDCKASVQAQTEALRTDPYLGEQHHQRLMGCLWVTQDKYAAIEYYRRFAHFLKQEIDDSPMPGTVKLAHHIKHDALPCKRCWEWWPLEGESRSCPVVNKVKLELHQPSTHTA